MDIITNNIESKRIDKILIDNYNFNIDILMENAARSIVEKLLVEPYNSYLIVAGIGNNGGDGLAIARHLKMHNKKVKILCKENNTIQFKIAKSIGLEFVDKIEEVDVIIDAIFGVGFVGELDEYYEKIVNDINETNSKVYSIDVVTKGIKADKVFMLSSYKEEMLNFEGEYIICDIGVSKDIYSDVSNKFIVDEEYINKIKPIRKKFSSKIDYGKVYIFAKKGASILSASASIKSGSGYTYLISDEDSIKANLIHNPECINYNINSNYVIEENGVIAIGPANGISEETKSNIINNLDKKMVIDADALSILAKRPDILKKLNENTVLTPHYGEIARILSENVDSLVRDPFNALIKLKIDFRGVVLLKGKNTIIYDGNNFYIINIGTSKMANAGMGDTLTGMIASYIAQGLTVLNATIYAAYRHSKIASIIGEKKEIVNPRDILKEM